MLRVTFRSLLARKLRLLLSATAIVLGVSFVSGALTLTDTLGRVFDTLFVSVNAKTDVEVRGPEIFTGGGGFVPREPVSEALRSQVADVPGVARAVGDVSGYAQLLDRDGQAYTTGGAPQFGINFDDDPRTSTFTVVAGRPPTGAGEVVVDVATAERIGFAPGDQVRIQLTSGLQDFTMTGTFGFGTSGSVGGAAIVAFDPETAQQLVGRPGEYDLVRVAGNDEVDPSALRERVAGVLPAGYQAVPGEQSAQESADAIKDALGFFTIFLLVFATVALFVGAFLIFNTFTILVAQRQRELALLRALGASRRQVTTSVVVEAVVVGGIASLLGLALGVLVAIGLRELVNSFGGELPTGPLVVSGRTVLAGLTVGLVVTVLAALLPARRASAVPPVAAMRDASVPDTSLRRSTLSGVVLLAAGAGLVAVGLTGELALLGVGALLSFLGVAALSPLLTRPAARLLGAPLSRRLPGRLGRLNAMRNPRRTASTAAALMVGLALVSAVSIVGESVKASVSKIVLGAVGADLIVAQQGGGGGGQNGLSPAVGDALAGRPEIGRLDRLHFDAAQIGDRVEFITAVSTGALGTTVGLIPRSGELRLEPTGVLLSEGAATDLGLAPGDDLTVRFTRGEPRVYTVTGTYADNQLVGGYLFDESVSREFVTQLIGVVLVDAAPGVSRQALRSAVEAVTADFPTVEVLNREEFTAQAASQVDVLINIINVLLLLSILIAVLGIVNTLALAVLERTRELGMLRAVGLSRAQTRRMVTVEAVLVAVFGALLGVAVGTAYGVVLQRSLAGEGITELVVPSGRLLLFVLVAALAGVLAAALPARRAARLDVLQALAAT